MRRVSTPSLAPSSQEGGNLIQPDLAQLTMTAPGSEPVTPLPPPVQGSHVPEPQASGPQLPVNTTRARWATGTPSGSLDWQPSGASDVPAAGHGWRTL
jgi:hypothetical protein